MDWIAETESGTTYSCVDGRILRSDRQGVRTYYHNAQLRSFAPRSGVTFDGLNRQPEVDTPVVGEHIYILTHGDSGWVISTPVVKLTMM